MKKLIPTIFFVCCGHICWAQSMFSAVQGDTLVTEVVRSGSGDYFLWNDNGEGLRVMKYDSQMTPLWTRVIDPLGGPHYWGITSGVRTPDDGICLLIDAGEYPSGQRLCFVRLDEDGELLWSRIVNVASPGGSPPQINYTRFHALEVNEEGELFVHLSPSGNWSGYALKLSATGEPLWYAGYQDTALSMRSLLPDKEGGCYFTMSPSSGDYGSIRIGRLLADGTTVWHQRYTLPGGDLFGARLLYGPDDELLLGGRNWDMALFMRVDGSGSPLTFRNYDIAISGSDCPVIAYHGFQVAADGRMALAGYHSDLGQYWLLLLQADAQIASGHQFHDEFVGGVSERFYISDLASRGNELTMHAQVVAGTGPGAEIEQTVITIPFWANDDLCKFSPLSFTEINVPVSELGIQAMPDLTLLPLPTVAPLEIQMIALPGVSAANQCANVGLDNEPSQGQAPLFVSNLVRPGAWLQCSAPGSGRLTIIDAGGKLVHEQRVYPGTAIGTTDFLVGLYSATFTTDDGRTRMNGRFVVE